MLKWWRSRLDKKASNVEEEDNLPFTAEEFASLIRNGRRDDFKRLAAGLSDPRYTHRH
jgi:hypothetical protein